MLSMLRHISILAYIGPQVEAAFKIYDAYTPAELQAAHGIPSSCSDALYVQIKFSSVRSANVELTGT